MRDFAVVERGRNDANDLGAGSEGGIRNEPHQTDLPAAIDEIGPGAADRGAERARGLAISGLGRQRRATKHAKPLAAHGVEPVGKADKAAEVMVKIAT